MHSHIHKEVNLSVDRVILQGELTIPPQANAIIIFSHGSGSSRFSKRNQAVANYLRKKNFGTLLFDLLTEAEDKYYQNRFNIDLLTNRLIGATKWLETRSSNRDFTFAYFGASTGAASALQAAAELTEIGAVVSRGGRPDLAEMAALQSVEAPTLLIVGSLDMKVWELNKQALKELRCIKELVIVGGASHLFEEQGMMDNVARLAAEWFEKYLNPVSIKK